MVQEAWLKCSTHLLAVALCEDRVQYPAFALAAQKWQLVCVLFVSFCS